jgi:MoxR-like ATPase
VKNIEESKQGLLDWQSALRQRVVMGQETLDYITVCLLARGHLLLEDAPGLGKTTLAKAMAQTLSLGFKRIQCTPDLLPSDITGLTIFDTAQQAFKFIPGPLFTPILLADEINRTSPRTQSALLEAMAERHVTVDRKTYALPKTFMVLATQNPLEHSGTYPLPEAQMDRFFMRLSLGYPSAEEELKLLTMHLTDEVNTPLTPTMNDVQLLELQQWVLQIKINELLLRYITQLAQATRQAPKIKTGVSPRAAIALVRGAQALALLRGRQYVTAQDIQDVLPSVWGHRIVAKAFADSPSVLLDGVINSIQVPAMPKG